MDGQKGTPNRLIKETSPYLLQHAHNPVDWYPWGAEAFEKARSEDKPVFLSIGYSTCHWCHVMAHESFEDPETAALLNRWFVAVKVDREERPDLDAVYMAVCQAFTGGGGWPASIFLTPDQKPFFAGTYFPPTARGGMPGLRELLTAVHDRWTGDRAALLRPAEEVMALLDARGRRGEGGGNDDDLPARAAALYRRSYDAAFGGFGSAPKFPAAHNLLFLMARYEQTGEKDLLEMAENTLRQMYRGGLFDHVGGGFCRYSTDRVWLAPHFEKMLYDNALLLMAYSRAYELTGAPLYRRVAQRTAEYVLREMTGPEGGFYSAQDADSGGEEGKYYLWTPDEVRALLGDEAGARFCRVYDITPAGNFEGRSIPNLLKSEDPGEELAEALAVLREHRPRRCALHLDDKVLTAWNGLMIAALCALFRATGEERWLTAARRAWDFLALRLAEDDLLYVSWRDGRRGRPGFLDDYADTALALLALYDATGERHFLDLAGGLCRRTTEAFADKERGGFFMTAADGERLIVRPKETYDGAMPSGNAVMAWVLVRLSAITGDGALAEAAEGQLRSLAGEAGDHPAGHAFFLLALLAHRDPPPHITVVPAPGAAADGLPAGLPRRADVLVLDGPTAEFPLKDGRTTYYVCRDHRCLPPVNELTGLED